jgi:predicted phage terminase large subunit-like protein
MFPPFELARHLSVLIERLESVERGELRRLFVTMPPRHGKSLTSSVLFPGWFLGRNPCASVITAAYGSELAEGWGRRVRNLLGDRMHEAVFPACRLSADSTAQNRFDTTGGGSYFAVGRGGAVTGRGADLLILDDLIKDSEEARSETVCRSVIEWLQHVAFTRLTPSGRIVAVGTRWSERDPLGWILREQRAEGWQILHLPAIAEANDALGRAEGEALWPGRYDLETLESIRRQIGTGAFQALYQGNPAAASGMVFRRDWFRTYRDVPASFKKIVQSWDTAFKTGADNDYSVCTTWGLADAGYYLLSLWRARVEFPELKRQVANQADAWKPHVILVEDKASGQSLIQELKLATRFPVLPIKVDADKHSRAEAITPLFEAGKVFLSEAASWVNDYIDELASFPSAVHDDCVDSTSQALNHLREGGTPGLVQFWAMQVEADMVKKYGRADVPRPACCPRNPSTGQHREFANGVCVDCGRKP